MWLLFSFVCCCLLVVCCFFIVFICYCDCYVILLFLFVVVVVLLFGCFVVFCFVFFIVCWLCVLFEVVLILFFGLCFLGFVVFVFLLCFCFVFVFACFLFVLLMCLVLIWLFRRAGDPRDRLDARELAGVLSRAKIACSSSSWRSRASPRAARSRDPAGSARRPATDGRICSPTHSARRARASRTGVAERPDRRARAGVWSSTLIVTGRRDPAQSSRLGLVLGAGCLASSGMTRAASSMLEAGGLRGNRSDHLDLRPQLVVLARVARNRRWPTPVSGGRSAR